MFFQEGHVVFRLAQGTYLLCKRVRRFVNRQIFKGMTKFNFFNAMIGSCVRHLTRVTNLIRNLRIFFHRSVSPMIFPSLKDLASMISIRLSDSILITRRKRFNVPIFAPRLKVFYRARDSDKDLSLRRSFRTILYILRSIQNGTMFNNLFPVRFPLIRTVIVVRPN